MPCKKKPGLRVIRLLFKTEAETTRTAIVVFLETEPSGTIAPDHPALKSLSIADISSVRESDTLNARATELFELLEYDEKKLPAIQKLCEESWAFRDGNNFR